MPIRANRLFISILLIGGPPLTGITASLVVFWGTSAALADEVVPSSEVAARECELEAVIERRFVRSRVCARAGHRQP
jgi:hypothetical protein